MLSQLDSNPNFSRPRPVDICNILNNALNITPHNQVHVSATRWTAKGNLIITGGHMTTVQQLQLASPLIFKAFNDAYSGTVTPFTPPHTRASIKWSKILINGLPTGVSDSKGAFTPDECNSALATENPLYAPLIIAKTLMGQASPFSHCWLVIIPRCAFEDLNGSKARTLLGAKYLYAFGTRALLRKWKQRPT
jgi:hypothetical protein